MKISKQAQREAKALFRTCLVQGVPDEHRVRHAVQSLVDKKPRGYFAIAHYFHKLLELDMVRRTARVESAIPLAADQQNSVRQNLARLYGPGLNISFILNPALIGGLRIQVGSDVYDGSVRGKLNQLQNAF